MRSLELSKAKTGAPLQLKGSAQVDLSSVLGKSETSVDSHVGVTFDATGTSFDVGFSADMRSKSSAAKSPTATGVSIGYADLSLSTKSWSTLKGQVCAAVYFPGGANAQFVASASMDLASPQLEFEADMSFKGDLLPFIETAGSVHVKLKVGYDIEVVLKGSITLKSDSTSQNPWLDTFRSYFGIGVTLNGEVSYIDGCARLSLSFGMLYPSNEFGNVIQLQGGSLYIQANLGSDFSLELGGSLSVRAKLSDDAHNQLIFTIACRLKVDAGGVAIELSGSMDGCWKDPFGVVGFKICDVGARIVIGTTIAFAFSGMSGLRVEDFGLRVLAS